MNKLSEHSISKWLKRRSIESESEIQRSKEIEDIFLLFDTNRSGTLEIGEISNMFKNNGIHLNQSNLQQLFKMVDEDNSGTLTFEEFKEFMLSEERQKLFTELMKKLRVEQMKSFLANDENTNTENNRVEYLPLSAERMMKYLKYKALRKGIYEDINENSTAYHDCTSKSSSKGLNKLFSRHLDKRQSLQTGKTSAENHLEKSLKVVKGFMKIFTGYNINNTIPSQNLINSLIIKRKNVKEANRILLSCDESNPKIKLEKDSKLFRLTEGGSMTSKHPSRKQIRKLGVRKSHGTFAHKEIMVQDEVPDYCKLNSVRHTNRKQKHKIMVSNSSNTRLSTSYTRHKRNKELVLTQESNNFNVDSKRLYLT